MIGAFRPICDELEQMVARWEEKFRYLPGEQVVARRNQQQRTIKQIVGHMVDSASNNTHRIIHMHYQDSPVSFPDYANLGNNDRWIAIQNYMDEPWNQLIELWTAVHRHFIHVVRQVKQEKLRQVWITALGEEVTLQAMILDFPRHFKLHIREIEELL
jgi:hypothetical protein